jgi:hypothetical protein
MKPLHDFAIGIRRHQSASPIVCGRERCFPFQRFNRSNLFNVLKLAGALTLASAVPASAATTYKTFPSPEDAARTLGAAANSHDTNALAEIFGPGFQDLKSPDPVQAQQELAQFVERFNASNHIDHVDDNQCTLELGEDRWPFAIPIVRTNGSWSFSLEAGKQEVLHRRIGANELEALKALRAAAQAQREYASVDRDGDEVLEYAQKMVSTPGTKDGLYWSPDLDGELSPMGPAIANAQTEGYFKEGPKEDHQGFHGYHFKILTSQGSHAPGGAYDYIINGNMIGGFAFIAWPVKYRETGVMTFIINQQGKVYQKDLGPDTESGAKNIKTYDPDPSWTVSPD